jgi:3-oxoacyl-[acyl-carrier protein] reductase
MSSETTALVTAAAGRIGHAVVERLLTEHVVERVLAVDVVEASASSTGSAAIQWITCDLLDPAQLTTLVAALPERLNVLVNVFGGERRPALRHVTDTAWPPDEVWSDILERNLSSAYRVTRAVLDRLVPGAAVCTISSIAATMPWAVSPAYGAAKAGLEHWSNSLAALLADRGVRVNLVRPGFVWSDQWSAVDRDEFERVVADRVPLRRADSATPTGREQTADDVAVAVAYLCSPAAAQVTGQAINIDGGATLVRAAR